MTFPVLIIAIQDGLDESTQRGVFAPVATLDRDDIAEAIQEAVVRLRNELS